MLLLVDISGLFHAYYHSQSGKFTDGDLLVESVRYNVMIRLDKLRDRFLPKYPDLACAAVFGNPNRVLYRDVIAETFLGIKFKDGRTKHEDVPRCELAILESVREDEHWSAVVAPDQWEADDMLATLSKHYQGKVLIHSSDRDCHSMLEAGRVSILKDSKTPEAGGPMDLRYFTAGDLESEKSGYGFSPDKWIVWQMITGGKDNIPGWNGAGEVLAKKVIDEIGDGSILSDLTEETTKLNKTQLKHLPKFLKQLPAIYMVRKLMTELDWPEGVPYSPPKK